MASPSPLPADQDEGPPPLRCPSTERAHTRTAGPDEALPQRAGALGLHTGVLSRRQESGRRRDPRDGRRAGSALRAGT
ncbi:hypothetical protein SUDANB176_07265 [Streptomyces sp. enrichment culture]